MEEAVRPAQSPAVREGRLTLFVGYASGCGKTYSMLREALERRRSGCDAVIGLLSPRSNGAELRSWIWTARFSGRRSCSLWTIWPMRIRKDAGTNAGFRTSGS